MKWPTVNPMLLPVKAAYFFYYFSFSSIIPFIPVFLRDVGLNAQQAGIIFGTRLLIQFFTGPIWGVMADKKRKHRLFLIIQIVCSSFFMFSSPWIPKLLPKKYHDERSTVRPNTTRFVWPTTSSVLSKSYDFSTHSQGITTAWGISSTTLPNYSDTVSGSSKRLMTVNKRMQTNGVKIDVTTNPSINAERISAGTTGDKNNNLLFAIMTIVFNIAAIFDGGIPLMIDTSIMEMARKATHAQKGKADFGKQRLWGAVGFGLAAFCSGTAVKLTGANKPNYLTMFYIYLASNVCLLIACMQIYAKKNNGITEEDEVEGEQKPDIVKELFKTLRQFHVLFWFSTIFMMGLANGLLFGYMFWFIEDLHGDEILMGLSILVACTTEVIMFPISRKCIKIVGGNVVAVGLACFCYAFRFLGFSYLTNPWYILLLQLSHAIGFAMFWAAAVTHTTFLAPPGMTTTLLGILNGIFHGVATGLATIFGGIAYKMYGGRILYRAFAIICGIWSVFILIHVLYEKRKEKRRSKRTVKNDTETAEELLDKTSDSNT